MDEIKKEIEELKDRYKDLHHSFSALHKAIDDVLWYHKLGETAEIEKVRLVGPPPQNPTAQTPQDKGNPVTFSAYVFVPRFIDREKTHPLLVYPHGGVHANFSTGGANIVKELINQGYLIIAPEYRGSTGYGKRHYQLIDYGGLEIEDTYASRNWMVENCDLVDPDRVGIMGWSHGGLHTLMNIFEHPDAYRVAFAGVPVSDLIARMGYKTQQYRDLYSADYHIGKTAYEDVDEYKKRSPAWNADKLQTPLLIHTTTNDEDVNVLEVEHLIKSLKAANKEFEYEIFEDAPGGHAFDRLDTAFAKECRQSIYDFLAEHLEPSKPLT